MNSVNNRRNHDFQILYFMVGRCHTVDGAYALLCDLREERKLALGSAKAGALRRNAARLRAERKASALDEVNSLEGQAELLDLKANEDVTVACIAAAEAELGFIERCMARLESHRKFSALSLPEAHEAAQREEWALELAHRAENFMITNGTIPPDEFATMRAHPDFSKKIMPVIEALSSDEGKKLALRRELPLLLLLENDE
jgi:hypothetical protein